MAMVRMPEIVTPGQSVEVTVMPSRSGGPTTVEVIGTEEIRSWPFRQRRTLVRVPVFQGAVDKPTSLSFVLPEDAPPSSTSSRRRVRYWAIIDGGDQVQRAASGWLVLPGRYPFEVTSPPRPAPSRPRPVSVASDDYWPAGRSPLTVRAELADAVVWPETEVSLAYALSGSEGEVVRRMRAEWFEARGLSPFHVQHIELPHAGDCTGRALLSVPLLPPEARHSDPEHYLQPVELRVVADVAFAADVGVSVPLLWVDPMRVAGDVRWGAACGWATWARGRLIDGEVHGHHGPVRYRGRLQGSTVELSYRYPALEVGLHVVADGQRFDVRTEEEAAAFAASTVLPMYLELEDWKLEVGDATALLVGEVRNRAETEAFLQGGIRLADRLAEMHQSIGPPRQLRGGLRSAWRQLARVLGATLDEETLTMEGSFEGLAAGAYPGASGPGQAVLTLALPFALVDREALERALPPLVTARAQVKSDAVEVTLDMHTGVAKLAERLRMVVAAIRRHGLGGPFR